MKVNLGATKGDTNPDLTDTKGLCCLENLRGATDGGM